MLSGDPVTTTYVYDGLGRLTAETRGEDSIAYTYDASGNRISTTAGGVITTYAYDANNRLLSETVGDTATAYTYDANGNTLTAGDKTYTYNTRGQQTGYSNGTTAAAYAYNPSGLRNVKTVGGSTKYFVYNGMNIVYEYSESVADGVAYFYGLNRTHNSEGEIYVYNAHGDVVQLVKDNSVVASYAYDAFGNLTSQIGVSDNPFLYCGEYYDAETQTYYLRARYYNPANGRFTQQDAWAFMDASDPLSLNLYAYCGNNPVLYTDPSGHAWYHWAIGAAVVVVCAVAVVATAGGAAAGIAAVGAITSGTAAATTASTVAAGAFVGSATVYGTAALSAAVNSSSESLDAFATDFNEQGSWGTVAATAGGMVGGGAYGYALSAQNTYCASTSPSSKASSSGKAALPETRFKTEKLQHEFKHAGDFGIKENWSASAGAQYKQAIQSHINSATDIFKSSYRGADVYVYYNNVTGIGTYTDLSGNYIGGWKFSENQVGFHFANGVRIK